MTSELSKVQPHFTGLSSYNFLLSTLSSSISFPCQLSQKHPVSISLIRHPFQFHLSLPPPLLLKPVNPIWTQSSSQRFPFPIRTQESQEMDGTKKLIRDEMLTSTFTFFSLLLFQFFPLFQKFNFTSSSLHLLISHFKFNRFFNLKQHFLISFLQHIVCRRRRDSEEA